MTHAEFAKKVKADTDESIYWIELTVAMNCYWTHKIDAKDAWAMALDFMDAMKEIYETRESNLNFEALNAMREHREARERE